MMLWFWSKLVPPSFSERATVYREFVRMGLTAAEAKEVWAYCKGQTFLYLALGDIASTSSKADVMVLVRAGVRQEYILDGLVRGAPRNGVSAYSMYAGADWRSVRGVIRLHENRVPPAYVRSLRGVDTDDVVSAWEAQVPVAYAQAAVRAGWNVMDAWRNKLAPEYLV